MKHSILITLALLIGSVSQAGHYSRRGGCAKHFHKSSNRQISHESIKKLMNRGKNEIQRKKFTEALATFQRVLEMDSSSAKVWSQLGFVQQKLKQYEDAIVSNLKAIEIEGDSEQNLKSLFHAYKGARKNKEALDIIDELKSRGGDIQIPDVQILPILFHSDRFDEAYKMAEGLIKAGKDYDWIHGLKESSSVQLDFAKAQELAKSGDLDSALDELYELFEYNQNLPHDILVFLRAVELKLDPQEMSYMDGRISTGKLESIEKAARATHSFGKNTTGP